MSNSTSSDSFWSSLIELNRTVDSMIEKCMRAVEPSQPISREIPFFTSIEAKFDNLPPNFSTLASTNSDALEGNNIKRPIFTNGSSRVYVRELGFQAALLTYTQDSSAPATDYVRIPDGQSSDYSGIYPINWRWNYYTSITQRNYATKRVLASSGGRALTGNHLAYLEPLVIEPMETLVFECELLNAGMVSSAQEGAPGVIISMILSGYREAI